MGRILAERRLELRELEQNSLPLRKPIADELSAVLAKGENKGGDTTKRITIVTDWWEAVNIANSLVQVSISRNCMNSADLTCSFDIELLQKVWKKKWLTIRSNKPVFEEDLCIMSKFSISRDQSRITIFSDSNEKLFIDIRENIQWFEETTATQSSIQFTPPTSVNINWNHLETSVVRHISNQELLLNKDQVTYLIGKNGIRIENIRQCSGATIKVLPISKKLNTKELNHPTMVLQSICITGNLYQVALAIAYIEMDLQLYKSGPRRMLL